MLCVSTNPFTIGGKPLLFLSVRGSPFSSLQKGNRPAENAYHKKSRGRNSKFRRALSPRVERHEVGIKARHHSLPIREELRAWPQQKGTHRLRCRSPKRGKSWQTRRLVYTRNREDHKVISFTHLNKGRAFISLHSNSPVKLVLHLAGTTKSQEVRSGILTGRAGWSGHSWDVEDVFGVHTSAIRTHRLTISKSVSVALAASLQVVQMPYNRTVNSIEHSFQFICHYALH